MAVKKFQILFVRPAASCRSVSSISEPTSLSAAPTDLTVARLQLAVAAAPSEVVALKNAMNQPLAGAIHRSDVLKLPSPPKAQTFLVFSPAVVTSVSGPLAPGAASWLRLNLALSQNTKC